MALFLSGLRVGRARLGGLPWKLPPAMPTCRPAGGGGHTSLESGHSADTGPLKCAGGRAWPWGGSQVSLAEGAPGLVGDEDGKHTASDGCSEGCGTSAVRQEAPSRAPGAWGR